MFAPLAGEEAGPICGGCEDFTFWGGEFEEDREAAFAEGGVFFEGPAFQEFYLGFGPPVSVGNFGFFFVEPGDGCWEKFIEPF